MLSSQHAGKHIAPGFSWVSTWVEEDVEQVSSGLQKDLWEVVEQLRNGRLLSEGLWEDVGSNQQSDCDYARLDIYVLSTIFLLGS
jgi:hypothetical protein